MEPQTTASIHSPPIIEYVVCVLRGCGTCNDLLKDLPLTQITNGVSACVVALLAFADAGTCEEFHLIFQALQIAMPCGQVEVQTARSLCSLFACGNIKDVMSRAYMPLPPGNCIFLLVQRLSAALQSYV